jgi:hypothetical protein
MTMMGLSANERRTPGLLAMNGRYTVGPMALVMTMFDGGDGY